jgi:hypothetical protein
LNPPVSWNGLFKNILIPTSYAFELPWFVIPPIVEYAVPIIDLCDNVVLWNASINWELKSWNIVDVYKVNLQQSEEYEINVSGAVNENILIFDKDATGVLSVYNGIPKFYPTYTGVYYIWVAPLNWDPINFGTYNINLTLNLNQAAPVPPVEESSAF